MTLIDQSIEFAAHAHRGQKRKGTKIPYISHPYAVGMILQQAGCEEEVVAAGILHDTLEDTKTTEEDLLSLFGSVVLAIVKGSSEPERELHGKRESSIRWTILKMLLCLSGW
jgi:(p)ppGpp synthase/HD superfamily hydrolase